MLLTFHDVLHILILHSLSFWDTLRIMMISSLVVVYDPFPPYLGQFRLEVGVQTSDGLSWTTLVPLGQRHAANIFHFPPSRSACFRRASLIVTVVLVPGAQASVQMLHWLFFCCGKASRKLAMRTKVPLKYFLVTVILARFYHWIAQSHSVAAGSSILSKYRVVI